MFHRLNTAPPAQKPAQPAPAAATPAATEAPKQERFAEFSQYQRPASEQDRPAPAAKPASAPQTSSTTTPSTAPAKPQIEETPVMTASSTTNSNEDYAATASNLHRPGQPAVARAAGFPGSFQQQPAPYGGAARRDAAAPTATISPSGDQSRLTISRGITISGEIEACDHLIVEGTVEASLKGARVLDVAEGGTFYGTVEIEEAAIAGRFEGDITVNGRLTIRSTGMITGSIAYKELEVESGAVIDGRLTPVGAQTEGRRQQNAAKAKKDGRRDAQPANNDGELFSAKAAAE